MGKRGPQPLPVERHKVRGTYRKDRHGSDEVDVARGAPQPPDFGAGPEAEYAREQWARLVPMLDGMGVLTPNERTALEVHCMTYADWRCCWDWVREHGRVNEIVTKENGTHRKEHPEAVRLKQLLPILAQQLAAFGLTPSSRGNLVPAKPDDDPEGKDFFAKYR